MSLSWPSKARVADDRPEGPREEHRFPLGDARPDFLCIGAQKGGTTWLYRQLYSHPDFWMPPIKELEYFTKFSRTKAAPRPRDDRDLCFLGTMKSLSDKPHIDLEHYERLIVPK